jgi:very-short-patch-repair endonuclease
MWKVLKPRGRAMRNAPTPAEAALWQAVKRDQLGGFRFRRQKAFGKYIADFYCRDAKLVIEVDGSVHDGQPEDDANRQAYLENLGLRVLRFKNEDVLNRLASVVQQITAALPKR